MTVTSAVTTDCHLRCHCASRAVEERERRRHSQAVQRGLPRPSDINLVGLKSGSHQDQKHKALLDAEELVKAETVVMLRHDLVHHPTPGGSRNKAGQRAWKKALDEEPLETFTEEELAEVRRRTKGGEGSRCGYMFVYLRTYVRTYVCVYNWIQGEVVRVSVMVV